MLAVRRILHYLKATPGKGILFALGATLKVQGYTNADYGDSLVDTMCSEGVIWCLERVKNKEW